MWEIALFVHQQTLCVFLAWKFTFQMLQHQYYRWYYNIKAAKAKNRETNCHKNEVTFK